MSALMVWLLLLGLCVGIVRYTPPAGLLPATVVMAVVTAVVAQYVEQDLGVSWIALAAVAGIVLFGASPKWPLLHH